MIELVEMAPSTDRPDPAGSDGAQTVAEIRKKLVRKALANAVLKALPVQKAEGKGPTVCRE